MLLAVSVAGLALPSDAGGAIPGPPDVTYSPQPIRSGDYQPFRGLGVWIDVYDPNWSDPAAAVKKMASHGVRTLYLQTSNYSRTRPFVFKDKVAGFVDAAHRYHVQIVAWYLPGLVNIAKDFNRSMAAIDFTTAAGNRFTAFGLDIEATAVKNVKTRTARLLKLSTQLRVAAGNSYPLGAIIPSPLGLVRAKGYWPGFPWKGLAGLYDAFLPMSYYTWHDKSYSGAHWYITRNVQIIRSKLGTDQYPVSVIGGIAEDATTAGTKGFVQAIRERGVIGASYYTFPGITSGMWSELSKVPTNPLETPGLPAHMGASAMGNISGGDTTHPKEVVFQLTGKSGNWNLSYRAFDAGSKEISIFLNWHLIGMVPAGPPSAWSGTTTVALSKKILFANAPNYVAFVASGDYPSWSTWGVEDTSVAKA